MNQQTYSETEPLPDSTGINPDNSHTAPLPVLKKRKKKEKRTDHFPDRSYPGRRGRGRLLFLAAPAAGQHGKAFSGRCKSHGF